MKTTFTLLICSLLILTSCEKEAGEGGSAVIKGTVHVKDYGNADNPMFMSEYPGANEDVYIIYGDNIAVGDKVDASPKGEYEFRNLREGKYTIFVKSRDPQAIQMADNDAAEVAIVAEVMITKKKEEIEVPTLTVYKYK